MSSKYLRFTVRRVGLAAAGLVFATLHLAADSSVTAHIPFAFSAAGRTMPAGEYTVQQISPGVVCLAGTDPSDRVLLLASSVSHEASPPGATFDRSGAMPQLTGISSFGGNWQFMAPARSGPTAAVALRSKKE